MPEASRRTAILAGLKPVLAWGNGAVRISCGSNWLRLTLDGETVARRRGADELRDVFEFLSGRTGGDGERDLVRYLGGAGGHRLFNDDNEEIRCWLAALFGEEAPVGDGYRDGLVGELGSGNLTLFGALEITLGEVDRLRDFLVEGAGREAALSKSRLELADGSVQLTASSSDCFGNLTITTSRGDTTGRILAGCSMLFLAADLEAARQDLATERQP